MLGRPRPTAACDRSIALDALVLASLPWADETVWDGIVDPAVRTPQG